MRRAVQRERLRAVLAGSECLSPASVFDPLSARVAEAAGFEIGMLGGSVACHAVLAVPDLSVITLTEFADLARRIVRASGLSLMVDADEGYGNALNVMRTVEELEHAGVSSLTIEDTVLPLPFGQDEGRETLISIEEGIGKMRAALAARRDPALIIAGRTSALRIEGLVGTIARCKAYTAAGVDAVFLVGQTSLAEIAAIHAAVDVPILLSAGPQWDRKELAALGVRILLQGHQPIAAAAKALREAYMHLHREGAAALLDGRIASKAEMDRLVKSASYEKWRREFLGPVRDKPR